MNKSFTILCVLSSLLFSCSAYEPGDAAEKGNDAKYEISSGDMNDVWKMNTSSAVIKDGEIMYREDYGNSLPVPGGAVIRYLDFDEGQLVADYSHYRFYEGTEDQLPYCEYVIDNDVSGTTLDFDKESRKGQCRNLNGMDGDLELLESDNATVRLLLDINDDASCRIIELTKVNDPELVNKLKNCEHRDYGQMWRDVDEYWEGREN